MSDFANSDELLDVFLDAATSMTEGEFQKFCEKHLQSDPSIQN